METHGTTYLISGCEIDFDSKKMPLKFSLRSSFLDSIVKLVLPIITYAFLFISVRSMGVYEINQNTIMQAEEIYELAAMLFGLLIMSIAVVYICLLAMTRLEEFEMIPLSTIAQITLAVISLILFIPLLSIENVFFLYLLLIASPSIKHTKRLIALSKLRQKNWKPEHLKHYRNYKVADWFSTGEIVVDGVISSVEDSPHIYEEVEHEK